MSIASEINRINSNITAAYSACDDLGAEMPQSQNSANLANTIGSIPQGADVDAYTKAETNALLGGKAPAIEVETESSYDSDLTESAQQSADGNLSVTAEQGSLGHPYLMLSEGAELIPVLNTASSIGTVSGVTIEIINGSSVRLNGTSTATIKTWLKSGGANPFHMTEPLEANDQVTVGLMYSGTSTGGSIRIIERFETSPNSTDYSKYFRGEGILSETLTMPGDCTYMKIYLEIPEGAQYENYIITPFAFVGTDVVEIDDPVYTDGLLDISSLVSSYDYLSTYPNKHKIGYHADTKTYIDNKEIDPAAISTIVDTRITAQMPTINSTITSNVNTAVGAKVTYITPEQYGAKGNGVDDDTVALQTCLNNASSTNYVLALKNYKITSPIRIVGVQNSGNNIHVEINRINYTGNDFAVKIATRWGKIKIHRIEATGGSGVLIKDDNGSMNVKSNSFEFDFIKTDGDCIKFEAQASHNIAYNNFKLPYLNSASGNLININGAATENYFIGGRIECPAGWCFYKSNAANTFARFSFENTSQICNGGGKLVDCRTGEALNALGNKPEGTLIKLTKTSDGVAKVFADQNTRATYTGIDISELNSFSETMATLNDKIAATDPDDPYRYFKGCYDVVTYLPGVYENVDRYRASSYEEGLDGKLVVYWNKKAYVPNSNILEDITTTPFVPLQTVVENPTYFRIGVADCVINLNDSYCPVGVDSFIVEQTNAYKASVYNKDGTLIFDGANKPAGVYQVRCYITPLPDTIFDDINMPQNYREYYAKRIRYMYTGSNEAWTVTPLS